MLGLRAAALAAGRTGAPRRSLLTPVGLRLPPPTRAVATAALPPATPPPSGGDHPPPPPRSWATTAAATVGAAALVASLLLGAPPTARADAGGGGGGWFGSGAPGAAAAAAVPASLEMVPPAPAADRDLAPDELATVRLFQAATPSVVNIANIQTRQSYGSMDALSMPVGTGSGFVWDGAGHIVTNYHVVRGASAIKVALIDSSVFPATFIAGDPDKDVAVLRLEAPPDVIKALKPVTLGTSASLQVGQKVFAIGNPFGLDHTLTQGIVSGLGRELATPGPRGVPIKNVVQTDAAINPGNSGGVLLDSKGRLVGINTAIADPTGRGASSGVGFAIPIDTVRGLVDQILTYGKVVRPVLGITIAPPQTVRQLGETGVLILDVPAGTPAAKAGLRGTYRDEGGRLVLGDIVVGVDGRDVATQRDLFEALDERRPGDRVDVVVNRGGRRVGVAVTLGGRELGRGE